MLLLNFNNEDQIHCPVCSHHTLGILVADKQLFLLEKEE